MEQQVISFRELSPVDIDAIVVLGKKLNPNRSIEELTDFLKEMFGLNTYHCFGLYRGEKLVGISSGWITIRFYSGKQIEIDNVIIDDDTRSAGLGKQFLTMIEAWAKERSCITIELNTYVQNGRSHKFYFNSGYAIAGYHFQKFF